MSLRKRVLKAHPATIVLITFLCTIFVGTCLLKLPCATHQGWISWIDALFTATSAVCVTGLIVVDTGSYFTFFGQCVILGLIQIGGLGVMTISVSLFRWVGRSISFRQRMVMQDLFAHTPREDILDLIKSIMLFTFTAELIGAILLTIHWSQDLPLGQAIYTAVFHAVSAFCNAGFALYPDSMMAYSDKVILNVTVCGLIVVGGIGFPVLYDLQYWLLRNRNQRGRLGIQTKITVMTTGLLISVGALMVALLERDSLAQVPSWSHRILVPIFQSVTTRTAGFNTVDIASLQEATLALLIFLMFLGASPGSCGGGIKTTTIAVLTAFTISRIRKTKRVNMFKKSIPTETVTRSMSLILVSIAVICLVFFMVLVGKSEQPLPENISQNIFLAYLFETVSAFGTVGLSMGITPQLSTWGKGWIILMMVIGRVGVLTFSYIIVGIGSAGGVEYSEENLMIG